MCVWLSEVGRDVLGSYVCVFCVCMQCGVVCVCVLCLFVHVCAVLMWHLCVQCGVYMLCVSEGLMYCYFQMGLKDVFRAEGCLVVSCCKMSESMHIVAIKAYLEPRSSCTGCGIKCEGMFL